MDERCMARITLLLALAILLGYQGEAGAQSNPGLTPQYPALLEDQEILEETRQELEDPEDDSSFLSGFTLEPAIGLRMTDITVKRVSDGAEAQMTNDPGGLFFRWGISSPEMMIFDSDWGFKVFYERTTFTATKQVASLGGTEPEDFKPKDLGTSASGTFSYVVPVLFWRPKKLREAWGEGFDMTLGAGIGYGSARIDGDGIFANDRIITDMNDREHYSTNLNNVFAFIFLIDFRFGDVHWVTRIGGPKFTDGKFKYSVEDFMSYITFLYVFE